MFIIKQVDLALEIYEAGLKQNPGDAILATKIGQALVNTHNYNKVCDPSPPSDHVITIPPPPQAITYYEAALKEESQRFLRCDLVELYIKLRQYDKAEKTLLAVLAPLSQESGKVGEGERRVQVCSYGCSVLFAPFRMLCAPPPCNRALSIIVPIPHYILHAPPPLSWCLFPA